MLKRLDSFAAEENMIDRLLGCSQDVQVLRIKGRPRNDRIASASQESVSASQQKKNTRKRIASKRSEACEVVSLKVSYCQHNSWRARRYSGTTGAQMMTRRLQKHVLCNTIDFDIKNCVFFLLPQIIERIELTHREQWKDCIDTLERIRHNRDQTVDLFYSDQSKHHL